MFQPVTFLLCDGGILKNQNHKSYNSQVTSQHCYIITNGLLTLATRSNVNTTTTTNDNIIVFFFYYLLLRDLRSRWITWAGASQWR